MSPRWLPIESNPEVMNKFLHNIGLDKKWNITDVYGLDDEMLDMVPKPVASLLLLFPITAKVLELEKEKQEQIADEKNVVSKDIFFMYQTISNACGTVAMIHAVANNLDVIKLEDGFLKSFLEGSGDASPEQLAKILEGDQSISEVHDKVAKEGQTAAPALDDKVEYHFVAFVEKDGHLYELDGRKKGPLNCGPSSKENFLKDAARECKKYMEKDPENIHFTVLALAGGEA